MQPRIVDERVRAVADALSMVSDDAVYTIESSDPQYEAVKKLVRRHGPRAVALVVANALVSYRLSMAGEEYWLELADYFERKILPPSGSGLVDAMREFLESSRGNRSMLSQKLSRLRKAVGLLDSLLANPYRYRDLGALYESLKRIYRGGRGEKTLFFAAKMAYYAYRVLGVSVAGVERVEIPVDRRIALLTSTSLMVDASPDDVYQRYQHYAVRAWRRLSEYAGISPLHMDALVWLPARGVETYLRKGLLETARDEYAKRLVDYSRGLIEWRLARRIAVELLFRNPLTGRAQA